MNESPFFFITGGCRSGKSAFAQRLAEGLGTTHAYLATAEARDEEMRERIALHRKARGDSWRTVDVPPGGFPEVAAMRLGEVTLFDCLTLWVAGWMETVLPEKGEEAFDRDLSRLFSRLRALPGPVVVVSNEVGMGLVPVSASARLFRDLAGLANQQAAAQADAVGFIISGLPLVVKGELPFVPHTTSVLRAFSE